MMEYVLMFSGGLMLASIGFFLYAKQRAEKKRRLLEEATEEEGERSADFMDYVIAFLVLAAATIIAYLVYFKDAQMRG